MAGKKQKVDEMTSIALTCKYMGWDWHTFHKQPILFIKTIELIRKIEAEEAERKSKTNV